MKKFRVHDFRPISPTVMAVVAVVAGITLGAVPAARADDRTGRTPIPVGMPAHAQGSRSAGETGGKREPADKNERAWSLAEAARPYRGIVVTASFLPRPGYEAAIKLIPEFERLTGIKVKWESIYYEKMREALVLDFTSGNRDSTSFWSTSSGSASLLLPAGSPPFASSTVIRPWPIPIWN